MKLVGTFEVTKGYEHWKKAFLAHESKRNEWGISTVFTGMEAENNNKIHVCIEVESMEKMMSTVDKPEMIKLREEAGAKIETQTFVKLVE